MTYPAVPITTPDFTNNVLVDAAAMDAKVATRFNALRTSMQFSSWVPALTAGTTNPTLGTANIKVGRYLQLGGSGGLVEFDITIQFGTASTNAGSGTYSLSLPVAAALPTTVMPIGHGRLTSAGAQKFCQLMLTTTGTTTIRYEGGGTTNASNTNPGAWTANDLIFITGRYEAA